MRRRPSRRARRKRSALSASNLRAELEKSWDRDARRLLHVARRSERANRGKARGNGRARQRGQDTFHLALRVLDRVAEARQCRSSARFAADGVFAVLARCGRARPDRRLRGTWHGIDGIRRARTGDAERPGSRKWRNWQRTTFARGYLAFQTVNIEKNLGLRSGLETIARRKNTTLAQLSIAWPMAHGNRAGVFVVPIPGAKSLKHIEENVRAADLVLTAEDLAEINRIAAPGAASGTRYPLGQMQRLNV